MRPWCRDLQVVTVPMAPEPTKRLTVVVPYYENPAFCRTQVQHWARLREDATIWPETWSVIVVDDGSPVPLERVSVAGHLATPWLRLFRIEVDVRWNWLAARNIGAHHADDGWLLFTDMDHMIPADTLRAVVYGQHDPKAIYAFSRREHTGAEVPPHSASFLMTKALFWQIGGYDETLSGHYGTDGDWRARMARHAPIRVLTDPLIRHEYVEDSSTQRYLRKQPEDAKVRALVARRRPGWRPKVLSFPYHEVTL